MMLTDLADVVMSAGFKAIEVKGWKTRGHGPMTDVRTIICHHTAGPRVGNAPSLNTVQNGRIGLPGPLAQLLLARDSTVYVVAAGLCYHAGVSRENDYTNAHAIGIEAEATGVSGWDGADIEHYAELAETLKNHYGASHILGHKETCSPVGRKSDPSLDMILLRLLAERSAMPLSDSDVAKIVKVITPIIHAEVLDVLTGDKIVPNKPIDGTTAPASSNWTVSGVLAANDLKADQQNVKLNQILAKLAGFDPPA